MICFRSFLRRSDWDVSAESRAQEADYRAALSSASGVHRQSQLVDGITTTKLVEGLRFVSLKSLSRQDFLLTYWHSNSHQMFSQLFPLLRDIRSA